MTIDFKMDERYPITPNIYLKGEPILHNRIDSLVSSGWEIIEIRGNVIIDFDTMTSEILRAIKCSWNIPDYGSQWTLDYIEDIDQWLDISHGFFVYISNFDDIILKNSRIASYLCQHLHRLQTRYRWELLEEGEANLKFTYGFECSEKNLPLVRDFFQGYVVVVDRFDPEHPELESAEALGPFVDEYPHLPEYRNRINNLYIRKGRVVYDRLVSLVGSPDVLYVEP